MNTTIHIVKSIITLLFLNTYFPAQGNGPFQLADNNSSFIENKGQICNLDGTPNHDVKFAIDKNFGKVFLTSTGIVYQFIKANECELGEKDNLVYSTHRVNMQLIGANLNAQIHTTGKSSDYINDFKHNAFQIHSYSKIIYKEIYPLTDWVIYHKDGILKHEFHLKKGADPDRIKLRYTHCDSIKTSDSGDLYVFSSLGFIIQEKPICFQNNNTLKAEYLLNENIVSYKIDNYNPKLPIIIDPAILWSTYYNSESKTHTHIIDFNNRGTNIATDINNNVYLAGTTKNVDGIAYNGFNNSIKGYKGAFLVKFNNNGERLWATYYDNGGTETGYQCATDSQGNVYMGGSTTSNVGIAYNGFSNERTYQDIYLVKFDSLGNRLWATYYGGIENPSWEYISQILTDKELNIYMIGTTNGVDGFSYNGHQNELGGKNDGFIVKFNKDGKRLWGTYVGGLWHDGLYNVVLDSRNNLYVSGYCESEITTLNPLPGEENTKSGSYIAQFDPNGKLIWFSYVGKGFFWYFSITIDSDDNLYLTGKTSSVSHEYFDNIIDPSAKNTGSFVLKINKDKTILWGKYFYGTSKANPNNEFISLNLINIFDNELIIQGSTTYDSGYSFNGFQQDFGGKTDLVIMKLSLDGDLIWSSYFGGEDNEYSVGGAFDKTGNYFFSCHTQSEEVISTPNSFRPNKENMSEGVMLVKINPCNINYFVLDTVICDSFFWETADKTYYSSISDTIRFNSIEGCDSFYILNLKIDTIPENIEVTTNPLLGCSPLILNHRIETDFNGSFNWSILFENNILAVGNENTRSIQSVISTSGFHELQLFFNSAGGCQISKIIDSVTVYPKPKSDFHFSPKDLLLDTPVLYLYHKTQDVQSFEWVINDLYISGEPDLVYPIEKTDIYNIKLIVINKYGCRDTASKDLNVQLITKVFIPNAFSPNGDGLNDVFTPVFQGGSDIIIRIFNRWGELIFINKNGEGWDGNNKGKPAEQGIYHYIVSLKNEIGEHIYFSGTLHLLR